MGRRGWPSKPALAAALLLHLALVLLLFDWWTPKPGSETLTVLVMLAMSEEFAGAESVGGPDSPSRPPAPVAADPENLPRPPTLTHMDELPPPAPGLPQGQETADLVPAPAPPLPEVDAPPLPNPPALKPAPPRATKNAHTPAARPKAVREDATTALANDPTPSVAVYDVMVDARGQIRSIVLAHSSGSASFDASGEAIIRNDANFTQPDASRDLRVFTVTIAFRPEAR